MNGVKPGAPNWAVGMKLENETLHSKVNELVLRFQWVKMIFPS